MVPEYNSSQLKLFCYFVHDTELSKVHVSHICITQPWLRVGESPSISCFPRQEGREEKGAGRSVVRGSRFFPSPLSTCGSPSPSLFLSRLFWRFFSPSVRYRVMPRLLRFSVVPRSPWGRCPLAALDSPTPERARGSRVFRGGKVVREKGKIQALRVK